MTDSELTKLAFKAAFSGADLGQHPDMKKHFNPLTDDGDNRRLQITLKASLAWDSERNGWEAMINGGEDNQLFFTDPDPKRAMVLLAAAIAEQGE